MRRSGLVLAGLGLAVGCWGASYEVRLDPRTQTAEVSIAVSEPGRLAFQMPAWIPGDYELFNYGQSVVSLEFRNGGRAVSSTKDGLNRWVSEGDSDRVVYRVRATAGNFSPNLGYRGSTAFLCGAVYGWVEGHAKEAHTVVYIAGAQDQAVSALKPVEGRSMTFAAADYDELVDSPTVVGTGIRVLDGQPRIVAYGNAEGVDLAAFQDLGAKAMTESAKMLPGSIGESYTFFLDFGGPGGGLEHATSTRIGLFSKSPANAMGIMYHEFFHAYNVKRIRPESIWTFDLSKAPAIESLWWLEGVTDYYAEILAVRAGLTPSSELLRMIGQNSVRERNRSATNRISAADSSRRVFETAGSQGFGGLSYYSKGWLIGACLDLSIRGESGGKHSLDDVMRGLWEIYKSGKGYPEAKIRELCVQYGGTATGAIYDEAVNQAGPVPLTKVLAKAGMRFEGSVLVPDSAATGPAAEVAKAYPSGSLPR